MNKLQLIRWLRRVFSHRHQIADLLAYAGELAFAFPRHRAFTKVNAQPKLFNVSGWVTFLLGHALPRNFCSPRWSPNTTAASSLCFASTNVTAVAAGLPFLPGAAVNVHAANSLDK